ncbi:glutamate receptor ionotropic, delta-2-like [Penaeus monodon]|uniref:glutamate receptor ionotropic, delta-2-like n=1 Tax=Penaeus monodon TaxID=6687 RepID=UPI0018A790D0|nr:glutamate receptor ionotropic, delta-2-like [Penaeus monodon]
MPDGGHGSISHIFTIRIHQFNKDTTVAHCHSTLLNLGGKVVPQIAVQYVSMACDVSSDVNSTFHYRMFSTNILYHTLSLGLPLVAVPRLGLPQVASEEPSLRRCPPVLAAHSCQPDAPIYLLSTSSLLTFNTLHIQHTSEHLLDTEYFFPFLATSPSTAHKRPPFTMLEKRSGSSEIIKATGFCFSMLKLLVRQLGFKYRLVEVPDGSFGVEDENGNWNGMVGMEADGAIGSFTVSHSRSTAVDFTAPFFEEPTGILLPKPTSGSKMTAFLAPFSWQVWLVTAVLVVVVGTLLSLLSAHFPLLYPHRGKLPGSPIQYITYTAKALLSQSNTMRQTNASRVLHSFWWLLVLTLIYSYSGTLIASLTAPKLVKIADSLEDLVNQREIPWTVKRGSVHETLFVGAQTGTYGKVGDLFRRQPSIMASSNDGGVDMVRTGDHAFIKDMSFLKVAIATDYKKCHCCEFSLARETFFKSYFAWIMKKGSVYTQVINSRFLQYEQTGFFAKWQQDFFPQDNECTRPSPRGPRSLGLEDLVGCFTLLGTLLALASVVFAVELLVNNSTLVSLLPLTLLLNPTLRRPCSLEEEKRRGVSQKHRVNSLIRVKRK